MTCTYTSGNGRASEAIELSGSDIFTRGVREAYERLLDQLPAWLKWLRILLRMFINLLTQKPLSGADAIKKGRPVSDLISDISILVITAAGSALCAAQGGLWLAPAFYLAFWATGRLRRLQTNHAHEAAHGTFFGRKPKHPKRQIELWWNQLFGEIATSLAFSLPLDRYREAHLDHHKSEIFTTLKDADAKFMHDEGFTPGRSVKELIELLIAKSMSPGFHARFFWSRIKANCIDARGVRRWAGMAMLLMLVSASIVLPFAAWLAVIGIWSVLYQASALLQFCTEHHNAQAEPVASVEMYADRCWMRIPFRPIPKPQAELGVLVVAWLNWILITLIWDLPIRLAVLPGELITHDWHHLSWFAGDRSCDWLNEAARRQLSIETGDPMGMADREIWGFEKAISYSFTLLSRG